LPMPIDVTPTKQMQLSVTQGLTTFDFSLVF
jgi:hypothetical protein